jgi:hypothetical protein
LGECRPDNQKTHKRGGEEKTMNKARKKEIHFDRCGEVLFYRGGQGKTVDHIRLSQADRRTIFFVVAFTDRTELSVTLDTFPVAAVTLYAPDKGDDGDLEPIAESGHTLLPESGCVQWDQIKVPPDGQKIRKRASRAAISARKPK